MGTSQSSVKSLVRACIAAGIGAYDKLAPAKVAAREWSRDNSIEYFLRAPSAPIDTIGTPDLVRTVMVDLVAALASQSAGARLFQDGLQLSFDSSGKISVPTILGDSAYAVFVKEGNPVPVQQTDAEPLVSLTPKKLAAIVVLTYEMLVSSNIEILVFDALIRSCALALDSYLFDDIAGDDTRPAGLRYNVTASVASTAPDPVAALMQDIETLSRAVSPVTATYPTYVASSTLGLMAEMRSTHGLRPLTILGSQVLTGTMMMFAVAPNNVVSVYGDRPYVSASRDSALQMDTIPGAAIKSIWQTDCVAIMVKLPVAWAVRSATGVAWVITTNW